jgi:hypothetical protein
VSIGGDLPGGEKNAHPVARLTYFLGIGGEDSWIAFTSEAQESVCARATRPRTGHSCRNDTAGSTRVARNAGV